MRSGQAGSSEAPRHECPNCGAQLSGDDERNEHGSPTIRIAALQAVAERLSDRSQTLSDREQTASDRDQSASDRDEEASADDQKAADRELATGGNPLEHGLNTEVREHTTAERVTASNSREHAARERLRASSERDRVSESLDRVNDAAGLELRNALGRGNGYLRAEADRARAAADRAAAARDRDRAADDRETAASLRAAAARDRSEAVRERKLAGIDQLTGVSLRPAGMVQMQREIERARRTGKPLSLVFVDVNHLKVVNDTQGHLAGDAVLTGVAGMLRKKLRPYDVIVRFGGDEFVCALANMSKEGVRERFEDINQSLAASGTDSRISFGIATLEADDQLDPLIARADRDLIETRQTSGHRNERT